MAYNFVRLSSQYLSAISPVSAVPMTIACFFSIPSFPSGMSFVSVGESGGTHKNMLHTSATRRYAISSVGPTATGSTVTGNNGIALGTSHHFCGVFSSNTSRTRYQNGTGAATNTTNVGTPNNFNEITIGASWNDSLENYLQGDIAEVGIWNVALTAAEIASLARGMTCDKVRPQSLVFYAPLIRDLVDTKGGLTITNNNSATVANHPRVYA
jgi:hypothetical protein